MANSSALAQGAAVVVGRAHAKGVVLLRATIPLVPCPRYTTLKVTDVSREAEEEPVTATIYGAYIQSGIIENKACSLLVPGFAGPNDYRQIGFAFSDPGTYEVRWQFGSTGTSPVDFSIEQTVSIEPSTSPDLTFLVGLGDSDLMRAMYGEDFFERQSPEGRERYADPEVRAMKVIGRLLYATQDHWVGKIVRRAGPRGDVNEAAKMLLALAKEIPESSYAPYAAYYAGCCYSAESLSDAIDATRVRKKEGGLKNELAEWKYRAALIKDDQGSARAYDAFTVAAKRADDYLKPRALYQLAFLRLTTLDFDEGERLLVQAAEAVPGEGTVQGWIEKARKELETARAKQGAVAADDGGTSQP